MRKQHVLMWPASALLTGNGVAFVLRVPGTVHGDWWSMNGWWIFAGTAAGALLSKYVIAWRGQHVFNPSNIGLVVCFLALGRARVEPLDFWWGPMSWWMALALAIIVTGGFTILRRLHLLRIALAFWVSFAAAIGVLALTGHAMTARWHLGPITGFHFWWVLVTSPEVLVFLFFMITDPKTAPSGGRARVAYALVLGLVAGTLIAPTTTEWSAKVALLSSLAIVCAAKFVLPLFHWRVDRRRVVLWAAAGIAVFAGVVAFSNGTADSVAARPLPPGNAAADRDPAFARRADAARPAHGAADRALPRRGGPCAGRRHGTSASRRGHRPGTAVGRRPARRAHVLADADGGRRLGAPGGAAHRRPTACRTGLLRGGEQAAGRLVVDRGRLPPGLVPLRRRPPRRRR